MSLLLDALNKADQERKRNEATPGINSNHENVNDHGPRNKSILVLVSIVVGLALLFAAIYLLGQRSATPSAAVSTTSTAAKSSVASQQQKSLPAAQVAPVTPQDATPPTEDIDTSEENVANLYQQNTPTQIPVPSPVQTVPPTENSTIASTANEPAAAPKSITQFANLPDLHDLPSQVKEKIPSLNYNEHNYNNNGGSVKINGNIHHANDQLANGLVIDKILEDGMILHIDNYSFKMRALNSWINM